MNKLPVDTGAIRALAEILQDTGLTEIEIADGDARIRVVRAHPPAVQAQVPVYAQAAPALAPAIAAAAPSPSAGPDPASITDFAHHPGAVKSPMVGVAYLSPEPGASPFVTVGQSVAAGQTLLLIEAMKTFNPVRAPRSGRIARILVADGSPVEYGEALVILE